MQSPNPKTTERGDESPGYASANEGAGAYQPFGRGNLFALGQAAGNRAMNELLDRNDGRSAIGAGANGLRSGFGAAANLMVQAKPVSGRANEPAEQEAARVENGVTKTAEGGAQTRPLIVEDAAEHLQTGQMKKSEFLEQLHSSVCGAAEESLAGTMWSAMGCPYIDRWFSHYSGQSSQHIESALRKYAPEAAGAGSARDYISIITGRVRRGIGQWRETGEVAGVPEELAQGGAPGVTAAGLMGGLVGSALSAVGGAVSGLVAGAGKAMSGLGRMLFKEREGGAKETGDPENIRSQLGPGRSLDGGVKARMESAFSADFSRVRIHTDAKARELSGGLNARAFTIGSDIAFGDGEYQPGDLIGEALIAHELTHVLQQGNASSSTAPMQKGGAGYGALEEDADVSAVGAIARLWGGAKGALIDVGKRAMPRLRSGLRLQRCSSPTVAHRGRVGTGPQAGSVEVRTGEIAPGVRDIIALEYKGAQAGASHWLQFLWIDQQVTKPGSTVQNSGFVSVWTGRGAKTKANSRLKQLTVDLKNPIWHIDTLSPSKEPYYPSTPSNVPDALLMQDRPDSENAGDQILSNHPDAQGAVETIHFETYLIQSNRAVYRVSWEAVTTFKRSGKAMTSSFAYRSIGGGEVSSLPEILRAVLAVDFPKFQDIGEPAGAQSGSIQPQGGR